MYKKSYPSGFVFFGLYMMMTTSCTTTIKKEPVLTNWRVAGTIPAAQGQTTALGLAGPVTGISNDRLLVAGGANFPDSMPWLGGKKKYYSEGFVFRKDKNDSLLHCGSFTLPFPLAYAACCSAPEGVVVAGGENSSGLSNKAFLLQWDGAKETVSTVTLPDLPFALTNAAAAVYKQKIYLAGGEKKSEVSDSFFVLDLSNKQKAWQALAPLPKPLSHAVMAVQDNGKTSCVYVLGGRKKNTGITSDLSASAFQFDLSGNQWHETASLPYALSAGTGVSLGSCCIILIGGDRGETFHKTERLIAAMSKETDEEKRKALNEEKIRVQAGHPGFSKEVLLYDTKNDLWKVNRIMPLFDVPVTTTAIAWADKIFIPGGEVKAGVRTPGILTAKIR